MMDFNNSYRVIPNALTILRVCVATYYPFAPLSLRLPLIMFVLFTHLDGVMAVGLNWHSKMGKSLGPIADKLLLLSVALTTFYASGMETWKFLLFISKDIVVLAAGLYLIFTQGIEVLHRIPYRLSGSLTIALQMAAFILYLTYGAFPQDLLKVVMIISSLSAIDYIIRMIKKDFVKPLQSA